MTATTHPTWDDTIHGYFTAPAWLPPSERTSIAAGWNEQMSKLFDLLLTDYGKVRSWSVTIYYHLHSRSMPLTSDERQFFPDDVLETFRTWVNEGCRENVHQPIDATERIPAPRSRPGPLRVRKNIDELTPAELTEFRMRVERLGATEYPTGPTVPWQEIAYLHTNWCLHYQEAFLLWHRAYLLYFEAQLGFPVPYWNFMSPAVGDDGDQGSGLPRAFVDETYVDAEGRTKPNPLRFAIAKDGESAACATPDAPTAPSEVVNEYIYSAAQAEVADAERRYVHRNPVLYTSGPAEPARTERQQLLDQLVATQRLVQHALGWHRFSHPEGGGYPWANIPTFPAPDRCYPYKCDFDGRFEQPHDNFHGWVGPDMGNNAYAAFDPVFWALHSNIDRVFENWLRAHPQTQFTSSFPLQPFWGTQAEEVELADPRRYMYTTVGDMARDSRHLGYTYSPADDVSPIPPPAEGEKSLHIAFDGVRCTDGSYAIDVFVDQPDAGPADAVLDNPHYVGRVTRIGMGVDDTNNRCIPHGITRVINADHTVAALGLTHRSDVEVSTLVTDLTSGRVLSREEQASLPGVEADLCWGS